MKRLLAGLVVFCTSLSILHAQTMSREEEILRNSYAKLSFMCELSAISPAAFDIKGNGEDGPRRSNLVLLDKDVARTTPTFTLSDFKIGAIADIANEKWSHFITQQPADYLSGSWRSYGYNYSGNMTSWTAIEMEWKQNKSPYIPTEEYLKLTVADAIRIQQAMWVGQLSKSPTRYAAYTVEATFQGKSTGPYRAFFLFGVDAHGNELAAPTDLVTDSGLLFNDLSTPAYLGHFSQAIGVICPWSLHGFVHMRCLPQAALLLQGNSVIPTAGAEFRRQT